VVHGQHGEDGLDGAGGSECVSVAPLVEEMSGRRVSVSPKMSFRTRVSAASPAGVEVPCALT
jgi:hypothetical protein